MSKIDEIRSAMVAAMKAGDKERKAALSFLLSSLKNKAIDKRADLTEEEEGQVILKEIKQLKETIDMTPEDRTDLIEEAQKRLAVLEEYAPKMMSEDEIKAVITSVLADLGIDAPTAKDKGKIMKELMPKVKGKADGKEVNQMLAGIICFPTYDKSPQVHLPHHRFQEDLNSAELHSLQYCPTYGLFYLHNTGVSLCQSS